MRITKRGQIVLGIFIIASFFMAWVVAGIIGDALAAWMRGVTG